MVFKQKTSIVVKQKHVISIVNMKNHAKRYVYI